MNYQKVYDNLVQKNHIFSEGEYFETHHIVPKSLGGTDDKDNLVNLTAREHYIAHLLLVKIAKQQCDSIKYGKMLYAFTCMKWGTVSGNRKFKYNSRLYEIYKIEYAKLRSQMMVKQSPSKGKIWIYSEKLKQSKLWNKELPIPAGWNIGRTISNWGKKEQEKQQRDLCQKRREEQLKQKEQYYTEMYNDYLKYGLRYVREKYRYCKTEENLSWAFKRYVKEYDSKALRKVAMHIVQEEGRYNPITVNMSKEEKKKYFTEVYLFYKAHGFKKTVEKFNWTKTRNSLTFNFRTYVDNYVPISR